MSFIDLLNTIWPILVAILVFLLVIVIHELGHFTLAKSVGIKVNEFAVGFGPTLFKKKKGETTYALRAVPFGGFCAMEGEDAESPDPRAFGQKKVWQRILVIVAGAAFNLILGFILVFCLVASSTGDFSSTTISQFKEGATSEQSGLQEGDRIVRVNGRTIYTPQDLSYQFVTDKDGVLDITVKRDGKRVRLQKVTFATEYNEEVEKNLITIDFYVQPVKRNVLTVIKQTFSQTISTARMIWFSLIDMVTGKFGFNEIAGPVGVVKQVSTAAKSSLPQLLNIAAFITVNLGVFNLLPLPALDGGRLVFLILEGIRRKPIPAKYEGLVHAIGLAVLFLFIAVITVSDIFKLFA